MTPVQPYAGLFPVAPTPFNAHGDLDLDGQRRVLDCMIDQGVDGICILANYSEQFLLSDDERHQLTEVCLTHVGDRVPVLVTCSHFSTRVASQRAAHAATLGAKLIMMIPPYHGAGAIPILVQDAPLSGVNLPVDLLVRLARTLPLVRYFKIEVPGTAAKLRKLIEIGGAAIEGPFDGEEAITLMADLDAGATGVMASAMIADLIKPIIENHRNGNRAEAMRGYEHILPLINFENRQCGLRAAKTVMMEGGVIKSDHVRHPLDTLHSATRHGLLELARTVNPLALRWGH